MADYEVGYKKPPQKTQFKPGVSGNPMGRSKRASKPLAEIIQGVLAAPITYHEQGRRKTASRATLLLKKLVHDAVNGNVKAAEFLLNIRAHAEHYGDVGIEYLEISDWLPDYPGQTADEKTRDVFGKGEAKPNEWRT